MNLEHLWQMKFHMQMVVSYRDQCLDRRRHLGQERQHLYRFLKGKLSI